MKNKVEKNVKLLFNFSSEKERWSQQMKEFKINRNNLLGDNEIISSNETGWNGTKKQMIKAYV